MATLGQVVRVPPVRVAAYPPGRGAASQPGLAGAFRLAQAAVCQPAQAAAYRPAQVGASQPVRVAASQLDPVAVCQLAQAGASQPDPAGGFRWGRIPGGVFRFRATRARWAMTTEESKAVAAGAITAGKVVDAISGAATYLAAVADRVPYNLVGVLGGDWLEEKRKRNREILRRNTAVLIEGIDPARLSAPSPSVMLPLMAAAADEERPALQEMWAKLLANAAIDGGKKVRRDFFETVSRMEPLDALILSFLAEIGSGAGLAEQLAQLDRRLAERLTESVEHLDRDVSLSALSDIGCVRMPGNGWNITTYGRALLKACTVD